MSLSPYYGPTSPEALLRETIEEIVAFHAEPAVFDVSNPQLFIDSRDEDGLPLLGIPYSISSDTIAHAELGAMGAQILTQEIVNPDVDEQLPHHVTLRANHERLGAVFLHITVPELPDPSLRPSKRQKGRPSIAAAVDSQTRTDFDRNFLLNEIAANISVGSVLELELYGLMQRIAGPVPRGGGKTMHMTDLQMTMTDQYLSRLFWPRSGDTPELPAGRRAIGRLVDRFFGVAR
jgi:hypothetical protein